MDSAENVSTLPPGWGGLVCEEDWRYLSGHFSQERLHDLRVLLGACPRGFGVSLVEEIRTLLPGLWPDDALVLALARLVDAMDRGL